MINLEDGFLFTTEDGLICSLLAEELRWSVMSTSAYLWKRYGADLEFIYPYWR